MHSHLHTLYTVTSHRRYHNRISRDVFLFTLNRISDVLSCRQRHPTLLFCLPFLASHNATGDVSLFSIVFISHSNMPTFMRKLFSKLLIKVYSNIRHTQNRMHKLKHLCAPTQITIYLIMCIRSVVK